MLHCTKKQKELIKRIVVYSVMVLSIILIVTFIVFYMLGYRFDTENREVQQYALLQFGSVPTGAKVTVDGKAISTKTPTSTSVEAGTHTITMTRSGYKTWSKTVSVESGSLKWLKYVVLIPNDLKTESVENYGELYDSLASPNGKFMLVQAEADKPTFDLVNLSSDTVGSTILTLPAETYSESTTDGVAHSFTMEEWSGNDRFVLVNHKYGDKSEWLVLDTENVASSKNISKLLDIDISQIEFFGTGGDVFYALSTNSIRKISLSSETISRTLVSDAVSFDVYNSEIVSFKTVDKDGLQSVGLYRDGDSIPYVLRTKTENDGKNLNIAISKYFNDYYVAISDGSEIDVLKGSYPTNSNASTLSLIDSLALSQAVSKLSFSPTGQYVLARSGAYFASYDLEYCKLAESVVSGNGDNLSLKWLNDDYLCSDRDGNLTIFEFDGANVSLINQIVTGQDIVFAQAGKFLYSFGKTDSGYSLQRVRMIISESIL